MRVVIIAGVDREAGKTVVALGIALNFRGRVEYVRPIREHLRKEEERMFERDAELASRVLGLKGAAEDISHFDYDPSKRADTARLVKELKARARRSDLLLVEAGEYPETGHCAGVSAFDLASKLGGELLLVTGPSVAMLDRVLMLIEYSHHEGVDVLGVVVNNDRDGRLAKALKAKHVPVLGAVPFEPKLRYFRAREIMEDVGGQCVAGSKGLDRVVENIVIGAMTAETALPLMRRIPRKCVITGGDRSDLQMAALSTDTSALVLTGGLRPSSQVLSEAHAQGVPLIVVSTDTYSATERIDRLQARINPDDAEMVRRVKDLVKKNVALKKVFGK